MSTLAFSTIAGTVGFLGSMYLRKPHDHKMNILIGVITAVATASFVLIKESSELFAYATASGLLSISITILAGANPIQDYKFIAVVSITLSLYSAWLVNNENLQDTFFNLLSRVVS